LPNGWEWKTVGDIVTFEYGKGLTQNKRDSSGKVPVYGSNGIVGYHSSALVDKPCLIIGRKGAAGVVHKSMVPCWAIDTTYYVIPPDNANLSFLYYLFSSLDFPSLDRSTAIPGLNRNDAYAVKIPFPPLPEQERIVSRIEELFSDLEAGAAALERVRAGLRRYKASVLKAACEGKLVNGKSENGEGKLPEGWQWTLLGDLTEHITSGSRWWAKYYSDNGAIFIRAQDINTDKLVLNDVAHVNPPRDSAEALRTRVRKSDLLVTITGANVTKTAKVNVDLDEAYMSQHVALVRPRVLDFSDYLYYWIISPAHGRKVLEKMAYGAGKPGLNLTNLRELLVALPPLDEQRRIVAEVERRLSVVGEVESGVDAGLVRAARLRQSVLRSAFEGKL